MNRYKLFGCDSKITLLAGTQKDPHPTVVEVEHHGTTEGCEIKKAKRLPKPGERLIKEFRMHAANTSNRSKCSLSERVKPNWQTVRKPRNTNIQDIIDKIASDLEETKI